MIKQIDILKRFIQTKLVNSLAAILFSFITVNEVNAAVLDNKQTFLDAPAAYVVNGEANIVINFDAEIRYLKHSPQDKGDVVRIGIQFKDPCDADNPLSQETVKVDNVDWHVPVKASFPELKRVPSTTKGVCKVTGHQVFLDYNLLVKFGKETTYQIKQGNDNKSIVIILPLLKAVASEKEDALGSVELKGVREAVANSKESTAQVASESQAKFEENLSPVELMAAARTALAANEFSKSTEMLNRLLNIPLNEYSEEAQQLVGLSREKDGDIEKAKVENELYIKLYPQGKYVAVVKKRLAGLESLKVLPSLADKQKPKKTVKEIHQNTFTGSLSQYYYGSRSQQSEVNGANEKTNSNLTEQSSIVTNISATERIRNNQYDTKIVIRDTEVSNFISTAPNRNTLSAAYIEHTNKLDDYMIRVGRQLGTSQGVLGRFDGVYGRYGITPNWRIAGVYGEPAYGQGSNVKTNRHFYGAAVEFGPIAEKWNGSVYGIQQVADDIVERRAFGTEIRYFNGTTNWFGTIDYDTIYKEVNIAMLTGNWVALGDYNFNLVLDHRKSPVLYGETAIQAQTGARSVGDLRNIFGLSNSTIYNYVNNTVPTSDLGMFGVLKQINSKWQVGGDVRYTKTASTPGAGDVPAMPGSGTIFAYTAQAIGKGVIFNNDTSVIMGSLIADPNYDSQNLSFTNSLTLQEKWRLDSTLRYYHESRNTNLTSWKAIPSVRINYYWKDNMSFEAELMADYTHTNDPISVTTTDTWRESIFFGYRWDIR